MFRCARDDGEWIEGRSRDPLEVGATIRVGARGPASILDGTATIAVGLTDEEVGV